MLRVERRTASGGSADSAGMSARGVPQPSTLNPQPAGGGRRLLHNPVSGERIVIRTSGAETGGRLLAFDLYLPPGAHVPARHVHPVQVERFTVVEGSMRFTLGRQEMVAGPGETVVVPPGTPHWFGNAGHGTAHARVEVRPALRTEELLEASEAMAVAGTFFGAKMPRFSELACFMLEFQRELAVPDVPAFLVRAVLAPVAWLARRRGGRRPRPAAGAP